MVVARLGAAASLRKRRRSSFAVDLKRLHFFDLETGATIGA